MTRVNFGCGQTPTPGWQNFDNSISVRIAALPRPALAVLLRCGVSQNQAAMIESSRRSDVRYADAGRRIPLPDASVSVLYSSHMLEHLERSTARHFLGEVRRVLRPGGILRLAVPNLRLFVEDYQATGDGDRFIARTELTKQRRDDLRGKLRYLIAGERHHQWLYDDRSLTKLLLDEGFRDPTVVEPGQTRIPDPGELNLREREDESLYVEAFR